MKSPAGICREKKGDGNALFRYDAENLYFEIKHICCM